MKRILFIFILPNFLINSNVHSLEKNYKEQMNFQCSYENSQYFSYDLRSGYCINSGTFIEYSKNNNILSRGTLNKEIKDFDFLGSNQIKKFKIEGNTLVLYTCRSSTDAYNFDCFGPVRKKTLATNKKNALRVQIEKKFTSSTDKFLAYLNRGIDKADIIGDFEGAIIDFTKAILINQKDSRPFLLRGTGYLTIGNHKKAIEDASKALQIEPNALRALRIRGIANMSLQNYSEAKKDFQEILKRDPYSSETLFLMGKLEGYLENFLIAINYFTKTIEINPEHAEAYHIRGFTKARLGNLSGAIIDFTKAIDINPELGEAYFYRGKTNQLLSYHSDAIIDFTKSIEINPELGEAYHLRGLSNGALNNLSGAIIDFTKSIDINPNSMKSLLARGYTKILLGDIKGGCSETKKVPPNYGLLGFKKKNVFKDVEFHRSKMSVIVSLHL